MPPTTNYYKTLQVDSEASQEVIEAAYKRLARIYHPDRNPAHDALRKMQEINEAYGVLRDPMQRRMYDDRLQYGDTSASATETSSHGASRQHEGYESQTSQSRDEPIQAPVCQKCGVIAPDLRVAAFPYVVSIVLLTFRRAWSGVYCEKCRKEEMSKAKLISLLFGWWGIPFGIFYTLGVLVKSSDGEVPREINADLLKVLAFYYFQQGRMEEVQETLAASYRYVNDPQLYQYYKSIFHADPEGFSPRRRSSGFHIPTPALATTVVVGVMSVVLLFAYINGPAPQPTPIPPTRTAGATHMPNATSKLTTVADGLGAGGGMTDNGFDTPMPDELFGEVTSQPTRPADAVVTTELGYDWVFHSGLPAVFLYPNGWNVEVEYPITDTNGGSLYIADDSVRFDVDWYETEDDRVWMLEGENRYSTFMSALAEEYDSEFLDSFNFPTSGVVEFEQHAIGNFPTFSGIVYEYVVDGNWTDVDVVNGAGGVVLCGPKRICRFAFGKADGTVSSDDWAFMEMFARNLVFVGDEPLPDSIVTPQPSPTLRATRTPRPTRTRRPTQAPTDSPTPTPALTVVPPVAAGWVPYHSDMAAFDARIPADFSVDQWPPEDDLGLRGMRFLPKQGFSLGNTTSIDVYAYPMAEMTNGAAFTYHELVAIVKSHIEDRGDTLVSDPVEGKVAGQTAVFLVYDHVSEGEDYTLRVYEAMTSNAAWVHHVVASGLIEDRDVTSEYYETFLSTFVPHPNLPPTD